MNWFITILLAFISTNATKYDVMIEYATAEKDEHVYGYVKIYGYGDKEKIETTKTIESNDRFDEWDETFNFDEEIDNYGTYESFRFEVYNERDEYLGETGKIWITEIKDCNEWYAMQLTIVSSDKKEFGILFVAISKDCNVNTDTTARVSIIPNDIINPSDPQFPDSNYLHNVHGDLSLVDVDGMTRIKGTIYGLEKEQWHGFHVHELGDLTGGCYTTGGHYNPFNKKHGKPKNLDNRHVGDLGNIYANEYGIAEVDIYDELIKLMGDNNVIGRAFVVHEGPDNLRTDPTGDAGGRPACGLIGVVDDYKIGYSSGQGGSGKKDVVTEKDEDKVKQKDKDENKEDDEGKDKDKEDEGYEEEVIRASVVLLPNENELFDDDKIEYDSRELDDVVRGYLEIEIKGDDINIVGEIEGLEPNSKHGFHIHEFGDITDSCLSTGGHFNPYDEVHGGPDDRERHVGDLGNIEADSKGVAYIDISDNMVSLTGDNSVVGRAFVVHEGEDDLKTDPTGDAGNRLACGVIGITEIK